MTDEQMDAVLDASTGGRQVWFTRSEVKQAMAALTDSYVTAVKDVEEPRWYGYENPNTFQDGVRACLRVLEPT